jgi:6-pyruvoyltetrahydropterin/6-carboxytetrahydropterin synthase
MDYLTVTKSIEWDMGHRIPYHKGKCRQPHGHHYRLEVSVRGVVKSGAVVSDAGMVVDFGDLKEILYKHVYSICDHRFMVYKKDDLFMSAITQEIEEEFNYFVVDYIPTAENINLWCVANIKKNLPMNLTLVSCRLYESKNHWVEWQV